MSIPLVTTRFSDETFEQNKVYREKHNIGCIYGPSRHMPAKISADSLVFVIEMNNTQDRIEGVGLIRNRIRFDKQYHVYSDGNYNRYAYTSQFRLDRETLQSQKPVIIDLLDLLLFKGKTHLKRGCGFTTIPKKLFQHPACNDFDAEEYIKKELEEVCKRAFPL